MAVHPVVGEYPGVAEEEVNDGDIGVGGKPPLRCDHVRDEERHQGQELVAAVAGLGRDGA